MARVQTSVSIDASLLSRACELAVDVDEAAEAGVRRAVEEARHEDLQDWLVQHRDAFRKNAKRDLTDGLVNESLRAF
ncbi:MAG TPA: type II toxin-antitoxin system CcdA family antitoxin [Thalassobaculum sp.]